MSIGDTRCDSCGRKQPTGFAAVFGNTHIFGCRECAGKWCQMLLRYIRGFDRDHPRIKRPRNPLKPIVDAQGTHRCRGCEIQLVGWRVGDSPLCQECTKAADSGRCMSPAGAE